MSNISKIKIKNADGTEKEYSISGKDGDASVIAGIPVDLTGIYQSQVIGYDEMQGKLVPMMNVARTMQLLPSAVRNWTITNYTNAKETGIPERIDITSISSGVYGCEGYFNESYILSEFTQMEIHFEDTNYSSTTPRSYYIEFYLSKNEDFSTIDAVYKINESVVSQYVNVANLKGKYFIKFKLYYSTDASNRVYCSKLIFS